MQSSYLIVNVFKGDGAPLTPLFLSLFKAGLVYKTMNEENLLL